LDQQYLAIGFAALLLSDFIGYKWFTKDTKTEYPRFHRPEYKDWLASAVFLMF
jgi:hypothetical protein